MKKALSILLVVFLVLIICPTLVFGSKKVLLTAKDELTKDDFIIVGLELTQPLSKITQVLGKPQKIIKTKQAISYYYPNIIIQSFPKSSYNGSVVTNIENFIILNKKLKTFRGIGIGDSEEEVIFHYGKTDKTDNCLIYEAGVDYLVYAISFTISNGKVKKIEIYHAED